MTIENLNIRLRSNPRHKRAQAIIPLSPTLGVSMVEMEDSPSEIAVVGLDGHGNITDVLSDSKPVFTIGCLLDFVDDANKEYNTND